MSASNRLRFNPPPGWPKPPFGWIPPKGWTPDPSWPAPPPGWALWVTDEAEAGVPSSDGANPLHTQPSTDAAEPTPGGIDRRIAILESENAALRARLEGVGSSVAEAIILDDDRLLQDIGIYRYHHPLENSPAFKERLDSLSLRIAEMVKANTVIERSNMFTFDGSLAKGRKMTGDLGRLMLRAYNAEADNSIRALRLGNVVTAKKRLDASRAAIAKLGAMMDMRISDGFHHLRIDEIELTADFLMKKQEERERAREERERLREERKVAAELAAQREKLEKERSHLATVVEELRASGSPSADWEQKLLAVDEAIAQNDFRAANIRAGYVYVISNRGAFGDHVVKIGLTRRLEPLERIDELGGASVPFRFDVHALYFSEDAVALEGELHRHFSSRRVNWANTRREFFFATPAEVRAVLAEKLGELLEFSEHAEATEYLQSVQSWPEPVRRPSLQGPPA